MWSTDSLSLAVGGMADGAGAARRRRERRLSSELGAALHHSRDARPNVTYNAPRDTSASSGTRPGSLKEREVQWEAVTVGYVAAGAPLLVVPSLAGGDGVDGTTVSS